MRCYLVVMRVWQLYGYNAVAYRYRAFLNIRQDLPKGENVLFGIETSLGKRGYVTLIIYTKDNV